MRSSSARDTESLSSWVSRTERKYRSIRHVFRPMLSSNYNQIIQQFPTFKKTCCLQTRFRDDIRADFVKSYADQILRHIDATPVKELALKLAVRNDFFELLLKTVLEKRGELLVIKYISWVPFSILTLVYCRLMPPFLFWVLWNLCAPRVVQWWSVQILFWKSSRDS